ncbi:DUF6351 family protein [Sinimarinibacterium sp. NLF-5-8]|uniref:DUF6351 family protein n=1 Tax=Sinimarinibacterium sp. NLF-5-8 TaxID=2698684 RepID=UPI00137B93F1|nr:DUF6351 family protein [Sinimarinibacterium sp. NLF-5-8]QHS11241.1 hypothetical protein GT972_14520 [Sinimarinibacterium sp. NLF-5-8]
MNVQKQRLARAVLLSGALLTACGSSSEVSNIQTAGAPVIEVMSNRADLISGGDALVELRVAEDASLQDLRVTLNGTDISTAFARRANGRVMGLVEGLRVGDNTLTARVGGAQSSRSIRNHPNEGPIFSRPEIKRLRCQDTATDVHCNQPPEYTFLYKPAGPLSGGVTQALTPETLTTLLQGLAGGQEGIQGLLEGVLSDLSQDVLNGAVVRVGVALQPYDPENPPDDVAMTTTQTGETVPFIVRMERGYQDRDQYKILTLFNPDAPWEPWAPQPQWNGKMLVTHGGNCGAKYTPGNAPLDDYSGTFGDLPLIEASYIYALGKGYAVMSTALANTGHNCDVALNAESIMMAKERFVEQYGPLRYTIGTGCSGGSIAQATIANAYPGLYQGLLTMCAYPDSLSAGLQFADLHLMRHYFEEPSRWGTGVIWLPTHWGLVEGHLTHLNAIVADEGLFKDATRVTGTCWGDDTYDPVTNPTGQRCGILEWIPHILGQRPPEVWSDIEQQVGYGFTGIPLGNVGVQYGLNLLRTGLITPAMFVDLNVKIGGLDVDIQPQVARTKADPLAVANAYRSGMINMANNLDTVAIINFVGPDPGIAHDSVHAWWVRWRLEREHGNNHNHVMWAGPIPLLGDLQFVYKGLDAMDEWLAGVEADTSDTPITEKLARARPSNVQDSCSLADGQRVPLEQCVDLLEKVYAYGTPRTVAGDTHTADNFDCVLKPLDRNDDYGLLTIFTDAQWAQLEETFPDGVCDYTQPGMGKQSTVSWLRYRDDSGRMIVGGEPLPPPPAHSATGTQGVGFNYPVRDR